MLHPLITVAVNRGKFVTDDGWGLAGSLSAPRALPRASESPALPEMLRMPYGATWPRRPIRNRGKSQPDIHSIRKSHRAA